MKNPKAEKSTCKPRQRRSLRKGQNLKSKVALPGLAILLLTAACGCASLDKDDSTWQTQAYYDKLAQQTAQSLPNSAPLLLEDCVRIALENNLAVQTSEINLRIATLERQIAFANFLPALEFNFTYTAWDHQPQSQMLGPFSVPMHDQSIRDAAWRIHMPILAPATWFLYAMHARAAEMSGFVTEYTRQMITLQVAIQYFHCLALQESEKAMVTQIKAAQELRKELAAFREEGLVSQWQADQADALVLARRTALHQAQRARRQAEAELLGTMGLSPLAQISLAPETPLRSPTGALEDLIFQALTANPQLHIADQNVAIQRQRAKIAIADFLPQLLGFASRTNTSNSLIKYRNYWIGGLMGVLAVFDGFANVHQYQAAREQVKKASLTREDACLTVILQTIKAYLSLENAHENLTLAKKSLTVAARRYSETAARWREGLISPSDRLNALAEKHCAQTILANARFHQQVSTAALLNVLGAGYAGYEVPEYEEEL